MEPFHKSTSKKRMEFTSLLFNLIHPVKLSKQLISTHFKLELSNDSSIFLNISTYLVSIKNNSKERSWRFKSQEEDLLEDITIDMTEEVLVDQEEAVIIIEITIMEKEEVVLEIEMEVTETEDQNNVSTAEDLDTMPEIVQNVTTL